MQRRYLILSAIFLATIGAATWSAVRIWQRGQRAALASAAVPPLPDLSRWPKEFSAQVQAASAGVADPEQSLSSLARLAKLYYANGFAAETKTLLETLRRLEPGNAHWPYLLADLHLRSSANTEAEQALQATVALDPRYGPAWLRLGDLLAERDALAAAESAYQKAAALAPHDLRTEFSLLSFAAIRGERGDPRVRLRELALAQPEIKQIHELLARLEAKAGDQAKADLERKRAAAAERHLPNPDPWLDELAFFCFDPNRLGLTAYKLSREWRLAEAENVLHHAIRIAPGEAALPDSLCHIYELMNRLPDAQAVLEKAIVACPDEPKLPVQLARILRLEKKSPEAAAVLRTALPRWPNQAELHAALGLALRDTKDIPAAAEEFRAALRLDATLVEARYNLGYCRLVLGEADAARAEVAKALAMRPDYPEALLFLGSLALQAGDIAAAESPVERLYQLRPADADARLLFATLQLLQGNASKAAGDLLAADAHFRRGLEAAPDFAPLLREHGQLALDRKNFAEALEAFRHYVQNEPGDPAGFLLLGQTLLAVGQKPGALSAWQHGRDLAQKARAETLLGQFDRMISDTNRLPP